jgi:hypothetical protein
MGKWSPAKEYKRNPHISPSYEKNVMMGNKGADGIIGKVDNKGGYAHGNPSHPKPKKGTGDQSRKHIDKRRK